MNVDLLKSLNSDRDTIAVVQQRRLRYFGHVTRMCPERYPNVVLCGKVRGWCPAGRPRKRWIDNIEDCDETELIISEATQLTANRTQWKSVTNCLSRQRTLTSSSQAQ